MEELTVKKLQKLAPIYSEEQILVMQKTVAKGTTPAELGLFLFTCMSVMLNPLNKEIYCYKDNQGNLIIFTGRDGMLRRAQENPDFKGMRSCEVCEGDEGWWMDIPAGKVYHKITKGQKERGDILGAYAIVFRHNGHTTIEWVDFKTYNRGFGTWKSNPVAMIRKVAESHALKKSFGMAGVQLEEDWEVKNNIAIPIDEQKGATKRDEAQDKELMLIEALEHYQGEDIDEIRDRCGTARSLGQLTPEFIDGIMREIGALREEEEPAVVDEAPGTAKKTPRGKQGELKMEG